MLADFLFLLFGLSCAWALLTRPLNTVRPEPVEGLSPNGMPGKVVAGLVIRLFSKGKNLFFCLFMFSSGVFADSYPGTVYWKLFSTRYSSITPICAYWLPLGFPPGSGFVVRPALGLPGYLYPSCCDYWSPWGAYLGGISAGYGYACNGGGYLSDASAGTICIDAPACIAPEARNVATGICELPSKSNGASACPNNTDQGNPINAGTGNKWQHETDYPGGPFGLSFDRYYNASATANNSSNLGAGWTHAYARAGTERASDTWWVSISRKDGKEYYFRQNAGVWVTDADVPDRLVELKNSAGVRTGWQYTTADNSVEIYNVSGKLTSSTDSAGRRQTLTYSNASTPATVAPTLGLLLRVTDSAGRQLNFTYDANSRINTLTDPAGGLYRYAYDANNNLASVTYPDGTVKTYHYENPAFPHALTGITDENGNRFATYSYDAKGRATSTEHAGGAERVSLVYNADGSTTVTDALNTPRTYQFQTILGVVKSKGQSQPGGSGCSASSSALTYDANGNVASRTDFNGNRTNYTYDLTRNLETSRTEGLTSTGATTPATRTITTTWHSSLRLPVQITNGNQQTSYTYNPQGDITQKTVTDTSTNSTRSWNTAYTYSSAVPGALLQKVEDGPRTDVADLTTYDYYPHDAACAGGHLGCRGQLQKITDALGHSTQLNRYSANGQLEQLTDPNGLVMTMSYDLRQRLTSLDTGGETTTYTYDPAGQLTRVTRPDGSYLSYSYDPAHRLIKIQDDQGNTLSYTLDAMGNRVKEEAYDPRGQLARSQSRVYDALSRVQNLILPQ